MIFVNHSYVLMVEELQGKALVLMTEQILIVPINQLFLEFTRKFVLNVFILLVMVVLIKQVVVDALNRDRLI